MAPQSHPTQVLRRSVPAVLGCAAIVATCATVTAAPASAGTLTIRKVSHPAVIARLHGLGHGHGMSQWGAQGAAKKGLSYRKILAFYYPHTALSSAGRISIRVRLSTSGSTTTVGAAAPLAISGVAGTLPVSGIARYRLAAGTGHTETLQRLATGAGARWATARTGLANDTTFFRRDGRSLRLYTSDGRSTAYFGTLRAIRKQGSGSSVGVFTVNRLPLEQYVAGVVPREMPRTFKRQALAAQAVAARTYGYYAVHHPRGSTYDICDTNSCQVYGGHVRYSLHSKVTSHDDAQPASDSAGKVLTYRGSIIFAQFDGSNGGWTAANGKPYLVAQRDPYDTAASGDPWVSYKRKVAASTIAHYYGLSTVTKIVVTRRDGHGAGGGRVLAGYIYGTRGKSAKRVSTDGQTLADALGVGTTWFTLINA